MNIVTPCPGPGRPAARAPRPRPGPVPGTRGRLATAGGTGPRAGPAPAVNPGQGLPPVADLRGQQAPRVILRPQQVPLPQGVAAYWTGSGTQAGACPRHRAVYAAEMSRASTRVTRVTGDVVQHHDQDMLIRGHPQQPGPERDLHRQVQTPARQLRDHPASPAFSHLSHRQHRPGRGRVKDLLAGLSLLSGKMVRSTSCRLVTSARPLPARPRPGPRSGAGDGDVVGRVGPSSWARTTAAAARTTAAPARPGHGTRAARAAPPGPGARRARPGSGPRTAPGYRSPPQHRPDPADQPHRQQRVPAQSKKLSPAPPPAPQHLREHPAQQLLPHRDRPTAPACDRSTRRGQRSPVYLPGRRQRQLLSTTTAGRHHVLRQPRRHVLPHHRRQVRRCIAIGTP